MTQAALALKAGVSLPTLRQSERAKGSLSTFVRLAAGLGKEIGGRSLPPGDDLGSRLRSLRERQKLGRRPVASLAGCSPTTLASLEIGQDCHLAIAVRVADALGVRLRIESAGVVPSFWDAAGTSSAYHGWTTPRQVLEALYPVVGGEFGLDPCSPVRRGPGAPVQAQLRFTSEDDGLGRPWRAASVFLNPPYGRGLGFWMAKARMEAEAGRAGLVIALVPARTDTRWWHDHVAGKADVWLLRGRLAFGDGSVPAPFPSALVVWSVGAEERAALVAAFPHAWHIARGEASSTPNQKLAAD
jgi:transcriptional regulator with XRE-family HTH domain